MDNYTIKQVGMKYVVFINLGNGYSFPLAGSHATEAAAETAYRTWKSDEAEKNERRVQAQPFEGTWG